GNPSSYQPTNRTSPGDSDRGSSANLINRRRLSTPPGDFSAVTSDSSRPVAMSSSASPKGFHCTSVFAPGASSPIHAASVVDPASSSAGGPSPGAVGRRRRTATPDSFKRVLFSTAGAAPSASRQ